MIIIIIFMGMVMMKITRMIHGDKNRDDDNEGNVVDEDDDHDSSVDRWKS